MLVGPWPGSSALYLQGFEQARMARMTWANDLRKQQPLDWCPFNAILPVAKWILTPPKLLAALFKGV